MNGFDEELARQLRDRSHDVGGHPIGMDEVRRAARRFVWRRRIATGTVAAAVLAVAVPAGFAATRGVNNGIGPVGPPSPSVTQISPSPTPPATGKPLPPGVIPLTTAGLRQGAPPAIPYLAGRVLHQDGTTLQLPGSYDTITPYHGGWLAVDSHHSQLVQLKQDSNGRVVQIFPAKHTADRLAVNDAGLVAWFESGGANRPGRLVQSIATGMGNGEATVPVPAGVTPGPVGYTRRGLVYQTFGVHPHVYLTDFTPGASPRVIPGAIGAADASEAINRISVMTKLTDSGSCSAVVDPTGHPDWHTCDNLLGGFSPNGADLWGYPAYFDARGPSSVTILNARTSKPVADFQRPQGSNLFVGDVTWEDNNHLLATVHENGAWQIVRLGTDGSIEAATPAVPGDDENGPFRFAARP